MKFHQTLRKWHRRFGIVLALFLVLQGLSGAWLAVADIGDEDAPKKSMESASTPEPESEFSEAMEAIHKGGDEWADPYRLALGLGLTFMGVTGSMIFFKVGIKKRPSAK